MEVRLYFLRGSCRDMSGSRRNCVNTGSGDGRGTRSKNKKYAEHGAELKENGFLWAGVPYRMDS